MLPDPPNLPSWILLVGLALAFDFGRLLHTGTRSFLSLIFEQGSSLEEDESLSEDLSRFFPSFLSFLSFLSFVIGDLTAQWLQVGAVSFSR